MRLYDDMIKNEAELFFGRKDKPVKLPILTAPKFFSNDGKNEVVLRSDMQCELGGGNLPAIGSQIVTTNPNLVEEDGLFLIGPDLPMIRQDQPYARIAWILLKEDFADFYDKEEGGRSSGEKLYDIVRSIEYVRYRVNPRGYMQRISVVGHREPVRVSRRAVEDGLNFSETGSLYLQAYHRNPFVKAVKMFFVTAPDVDYERLTEQTKKAELVTQALDHVLKDFKMNCASCQLKEICDEVEELKKLHFRGVEGALEKEYKGE